MATQSQNMKDTFSKTLKCALLNGGFQALPGKQEQPAVPVMQPGLVAVQHNVRNLLQSSLLDGRLSAALRDSNTAATPEQQTHVTQNLEVVRRSLRGALEQALDGNRLSDALKAARMKTLQKDAKVDGCVDEVLAVHCPAEKCHVEAARHQIRDQLQSSLNDGRLWAALKAARIKTARQRVKEALGNAALDGRLDVVLADRLSAVMQDKEAVRHSVRDVLQGSVDDGRLVAALKASRMKATQQHQSSVEDGRLVAALKASKIKATQQRVKETLGNAALDGSLDVALAENRSARPREVDTVRQQIRDVLRNSVNGGHLLAALQATQAKTSPRHELVAPATENLGNSINVKQQDLLCQLRGWIAARDVGVLTVTAAQLRELYETARDVGAAAENSVDMVEAQQKIDAVERCEAATDLAAATVAVGNDGVSGAGPATLPDLKAARHQIRNALRTSSTMKALRQHLRETLSSAALDGRLDVVLAEQQPAMLQDSNVEAKERNAAVVDVGDHVDNSHVMTTSPALLPTTDGVAAGNNLDSELVGSVDRSQFRVATRQWSPESMPAVAKLSPLAHSWQLNLAEEKLPKVATPPLEKCRTPSRVQRRIMGAVQRAPADEVESHELHARYDSFPFKSCPSQFSQSSPIKPTRAARSAMAMDLGEDVASSVDLRTVKLDQQLCSMFGSKGSIGKAPRVSLPALPNKQTAGTAATAAGSVAWCVRRARSAPRWGSAQMVF